MRLWHQALITQLPRQQLLGQHRECCALRGNGWGKPHSTVNYVFTHPYVYLAAYHTVVLNELKRRGYKPDEIWFDHCYRGKSHEPKPYTDKGYNIFRGALMQVQYLNQNVYPEHDENYLVECVNNLEGKGIVLPTQYQHNTQGGDTY